jgi:hypothetical protein
MSSDSNRPNSEWWKQPAPPVNDDTDPFADAGAQETRAVPLGDAGYPQAGQGYPAETQAYPAENQGYQGYEQGQRFPQSGQAYPQGNQSYPQSGQAYPQGNQSYPQSGQAYPQGNRAYPQDSQDYQQGNQAYSQGNQDYQQGQGFPQSGQGFPQGTQAYTGSQDYQGSQRLPGDQGYTTPAAQDYQAPPRMRRRRRKWPIITLVVIILVLVGGDRAAAAITEDQMASQVQSSLALSGKPHVTIQGFPFLTQLAARDFKTVNVNATDETTGPLEIETLTATLHGMHIHGLNSATIDQFTASALVNFTALAKAGGIPQGITLMADGPNKVKANISIGPLSETAVAQVTQSGAGTINVKVIDAGDIPVSALGSLANFNVSIPKLPAGVSISSVSVTQQGLRITATGHNTTLSQ